MKIVTFLAGQSLCIFYFLFLFWKITFKNPRFVEPHDSELSTSYIQSEYTVKCFTSWHFWKYVWLKTKSITCNNFTIVKSLALDFPYFPQICPRYCEVLRNGFLALALHGVALYFTMPKGVLKWRKALPLPPERVLSQHLRYRRSNYGSRRLPIRIRNEGLLSGAK